MKLLISTVTKKWICLMYNNKTSSYWWIGYRTKCIQKQIAPYVHSFSFMSLCGLFWKTDTSVFHYNSKLFLLIIQMRQTEEKLITLKHFQICERIKTCYWVHNCLMRFYLWLLYLHTGRLILQNRSPFNLLYFMQKQDICLSVGMN